MKTLTSVASALLVMASAPAFAGSLTYNDFSNTTGLSLAGNASASQAGLVLTPATAMSSGAALTSTALALGASPSFSTTFSFDINTVAGVPSANGFAFVLTSDPTGVGTANQALGLTGATSLAVEFSDYGNKNLNPSIGGGLYNSNIVAAIQNGSTNLQSNATGSYGSPGGVQSCVSGGPTANCMNNGDVWTANITYANGLLNVAVEDGKGGFMTVISNYAIALGSNIYAGFSGSTGTYYQSVDILNWSMNYNVPEPMTLGMFGVGMAALGFVRNRRRTA